VWVAEENETSSLVTWNTKHYKGLTMVTVLTPNEFLKAGSP